MRSFWARIPEEIKFITFTAVVIGATVALLREPSASTKKPPSSLAKTSPQTVPTPSLEGLYTPFPQDLLPSPIDPLPQISPSIEGLGKDPLAVTPSPLPEIPLPDSLISSSPSKSLKLPLSGSPSPGKISKQKVPNETDLTGNPSPSVTVPVIPPELLSPSPTTLPSSSDAIGDKKTPPAEIEPKNTNTNKNAIVTEVNNYFKKNWQPPSALKEELKYSILLNADGTIQQIFPLNNAATEYINSTNIPLPGNSLVAPVEGGSPTGINLVLSPNGTVKVALEEVKLPSSSPNSSPSEARP